MALLFLSHLNGQNGCGSAPEHCSMEGGGDLALQRDLSCEKETAKHDPWVVPIPGHPSGETTSS